MALPGAMILAAFIVHPDTLVPFISGVAAFDRLNTFQKYEAVQPDIHSDTISMPYSSVNFIALTLTFTTQGH
jgi:hypothetical protein